jgi:hypothetical protein
MVGTATVSPLFLVLTPQLAWRAGITNPLEPYSVQFRITPLISIPKGVARGGALGRIAVGTESERWQTAVAVSASPPCMRLNLQPMD